MLSKLSCSVTFPTTGHTLNGEFDFKSGFGVITGAHEQGKSLIIEVRWGLLGSAALRGKAEDYKTLQATLEFSARGQSYVVDRTFTTAKLMQGNAVLYTGGIGSITIRPSAHRYSIAMVRPSIQPTSRSRSTKDGVIGRQLVDS